MLGRSRVRHAHSTNLGFCSCCSFPAISSENIRSRRTRVRTKEEDAGGNVRTHNSVVTTCRSQNSGNSEFTAVAAGCPADPLERTFCQSVSYLLHACFSHQRQCCEDRVHRCMPPGRGRKYVLLGGQKSRRDPDGLQTLSKPNKPRPQLSAPERPELSEDMNYAKLHATICAQSWTRKGACRVVPTKRCIRIDS